MNKENVNFIDDIQDNQIRVIGENFDTDSSNEQSGQKHPDNHHFPIWLYILFGLIAILLLWGIYSISSSKESVEEPVVGMDETVSEVPEKKSEPKIWFGTQVDSLAKGFTEICDTLINDIQLRLFIPHNATATLLVGKPDKSDKNIVFIAQAADIRRDNRKIVGSFVNKGELLAKGSSKAGFCAIIDNQITVSSSPNSDLFEEAIERDGYFFRQFPLVYNGELVENEQRGKSIRRALCERQGQIFMVETLTIESFHDFSQALVDLGTDNAIYLVGGAAYGWATDQQDNRLEFGQEKKFISQYINYLVWKRK